MVTESDLVTLKMEALYSSGLLEQTFTSMYEKMAITWSSQVNFTSTHEIFIVFLPPMPHMSLTDFVVFPPGHGRSVTDFWGWDAHEAWLCCPNDVSGDIGGCSARRALKLRFY